MSEYSDYIEQAWKFWRGYTSKIESRFHLSVDIQPSRIKVVEDRNQQSVLGSWLDEDILYISQSDLNEGLPLNGIIARVCLEAALKPMGLCKECIDDLSIEFGRQELRESDTLWIKMWEQYAPYRPLANLIKYIPFITFPQLEHKVGKQGLTEIVREICVMTKKQDPLDFEEYMTYLVIRVTLFSVALSHIELKLIEALVVENIQNLTKISEENGVTLQWISRKTKDLEKRGVLRPLYKIPFSRIGIRMFFLFIRFPKGVHEIFPIVQDCPFLYSHRRMTAGYWQAHSLLGVANNEQSVRLLEKAVERIRDLGADAILSEVVSSGARLCFDHYDIDKGEWSIPWELMQIELDRIHREDLAKVIPRIDIPARMTPLRLDETDMKMLHLIRFGTTSVAAIRKEMGIGQHKVASRLKAFKEDGLVSHIWEVHGLGLNENVIVEVRNREFADNLAAWSQRLPKSSISFIREGHLYLTLQLPKGGSSGVSTAIRSQDQDVNISLMEQKVQGAWRFPIDLWDVESQKWMCPEEELSKWIESI
jgi:DNA-binding Lrp family transcriptional regulator